jgi:hypothetical protein
MAEVCFKILFHVCCESYLRVAHLKPSLMRVQLRPCQKDSFVDNLKSVLQNLEQMISLERILTHKFVSIEATWIKKKYI